MLPGMLERELKLAVGDDLVWPPTLPGETLDTRVFESVYVDTPHRTLARAGITLRRRIEHGRGVWQLKLPEGLARREIEARGGKVPPPKLRAFLFAHLACGPLETVAALRTTRLGFRVQADGRAVADVVLDDVEAVDPQGAPIRFRELEIELVDGDERALGEIRDVLVAAGARVRSGKPKLFRVLGFEPAKPPRRSAPAIEHVRAAIARQVEALLAHDPAVRMSDDVEELHDLRVATRRLRAILRATRRLLGPERVEPLRAELGWLGSALGPARDVDVMLEYLVPEVEALPEPDQEAGRRLLELFDTDREAAREEVVAALRSKRYARLVAALDELAHDTGPVADDVPVVKLARRELRRLAKAMEDLGPSPPDETLHAARIVAKRARYAAELAAPVVGSRGEKVVARVKALQDVIGSHQDAAVLEERLRAVESRAEPPSVGLVAGMLVERQRHRRRDARAAVPGAWERVVRAGKKAWA